MGNDLGYARSAHTRNLLLLVGMVFGSLLFIEYAELPYSSIVSSLFTSGKSQVEPVSTFSARNTSTSPISSQDLSYLHGLNPESENATNKKSSNAVAVDGKDMDVTNTKSFNDASDNDMDPEEEDVAKDFLDTDHNSTINEDNGSFSGKTRESNDEFPKNSNGSALSNSTIDEDNGSFFSGKTGESNDEFPKNSNGSTLSNHDGMTVSSENPEKSLDDLMNSPLSHNSIGNGLGSDKNANMNILNPEVSTTVKDPSTSKTIPKSGVKGLARAVIPLSKMNSMLRESRVSYKALKPRWASTADQELVDTRSLIENAEILKKDPQFDVSLYRNFSEFKRSYELMEQTLKIYIYSEGEQPIFHRPPLKGIYASEGWFMKLLKSNKKFITKNPNKAHLFYLPFSSRMLEVTLYLPDSHDRSKLIDHLSNYVEMISRKYPFWNRTAGSDHFLVACHDWAPAETRRTMANCIRALCNADIKAGFKFGKDVSLPETYVRSPQNPLRQLGGKPPSQRKFLAFFAGNMHGYLRPILLKHWENKDPNMKIFGYMPKVKGQMGYTQYMKSSKYCICARGYEVNSPRVVEAIFYECVPVIISDNFVPPFFETLNWESFAVFVLEKDIPNLKSILESIPRKRYLKMQQRVKKVQQHFLWHSRAVRYDVFHMILHSVWYNRVFQTRVSV